MPFLVELIQQYSTYTVWYMYTYHINAAHLSKKKVRQNLIFRLQNPCGGGSANDIFLSFFQPYGVFFQEMGTRREEKKSPLSVALSGNICFPKMSAGEKARTGERQAGEEKEVA